MLVEPRTMKQSLRMKSGVFVISIDFELIWGTLDKPKWTEFRELCRIEREQVIDRLLDLFVKYEMPATWCTVGHLFLDRCEHRNGRAHPEIPRLSGSADDVRIGRDPGTCESRDGIFYGRSLVEKIARCAVKQEIGSHSFAHILFDERTCPRATAQADIEAAVQVARKLGIDLRSFVFPRNRIGHLDVLRENGFLVFRGQDPAWHHRSENRNVLHRIGHLTDVLLAAEPPVVMPQRHSSGMYEIPGSMLYTPSYGVRGRIPISLRVSRARKGLKRAVEERRIFHLWFHPTDLVLRMDAMFEGLREILDIAAEMRAKGDLEFLSMSDAVLDFAGHLADGGQRQAELAGSAPGFGSGFAARMAAGKSSE